MAATEKEFSGVVFKSGNSLVIVIPDDITEKMGIKIGTRLGAKVRVL